MRELLSLSELGLQIQEMNDSYVRFEIFKEVPFKMNFYVDLNLADIDRIIQGLTEERIRLLKRMTLTQESQSNV